MTRDDFTDAKALRAYVRALPRAARDAYLARNPSFAYSDHGDLTHAQWVRYGVLRARRGTGAAYAYATQIRRAAWKPSHAPGHVTHLARTLLTFIFVTCAGIGALGYALIWYTH